MNILFTYFQHVKEHSYERTHSVVVNTGFEPINIYCLIYGGPDGQLSNGKERKSELFWWRITDSNR